MKTAPAPVYALALFSSEVTDVGYLRASDRPVVAEKRLAARFASAAEALSFAPDARVWPLAAGWAWRAVRVA